VTRRSNVEPELDLASAGTARFFLYLARGAKKPAVAAGGQDLERWARAWARRWWVVLAGTADQARESIVRYDRKCARVGPATPVRAASFGIIEAGHNAPGGPDPPGSGARRDRGPRRPSPGALERRRATARGSPELASSAR
jgi:hypothetical protein